MSVSEATRSWSDVANVPWTLVMVVVVVAAVMALAAVVSSICLRSDSAA